MKTMPIFVVITRDDDITISVHATHANAQDQLKQNYDTDAEEYGDSVTWDDDNMESYYFDNHNGNFSYSYIEAHQLEIPDGSMPEGMGVSSRGAGVVDLIKTGRF